MTIASNQETYYSNDELQLALGIQNTGADYLADLYLVATLGGAYFSFLDLSPAVAPGITPIAPGFNISAGFDFMSDFENPLVSIPFGEITAIAEPEFIWACQHASSGTIYLDSVKIKLSPGGEGTETPTPADTVTPGTSTPEATLSPAPPTDTPLPPTGTPG